MLSKWFGTCTPCSAQTDRFVRPELEALEDRLPPSAVHGNGGHDGDGGGPPVHANVHVQENVHSTTNVTITNSFNGSTITNSFNGSTLTNAFNGQNLALMALPQSTMQGMFSTLYQQAAHINAAAANALVADEALLAIDSFLMFQGIPGLSSNILSLQSAIASNSLETSSVGVMLGQVTFDAVLDGLLRSPASSAV